MNNTSNTKSVSPIVEILREAFGAEWSPVSCIRDYQARDYAKRFAKRYPDLALICGTRIDAAIKIMTIVGARQRGDGPGLFQVQSQSNKLGWYHVDLINHTCTCPDHPKISAAGGMCKHRLSVGLQVLGPTWVRQDMEIASKSEARRHSSQALVNREIAISHAHAATEKAWDEQIAITDCWEWAVEKYGYHDPRSEALREEMLASIRKAESLQAFENKL